MIAHLFGGLVSPRLSVLGSGPDDVFTASFYRDTNNEVRAAYLTHQNITAGVTAIRAILPSSAPLSALDTVISGHSLSTAFGRTIAYTALYEGTSFATLESAKLFELQRGMTYLTGLHFPCLPRTLQRVRHLPLMTSCQQSNSDFPPRQSSFSNPIT